MVRDETSHLPATALTHPGEIGKNNEDRYAVVGYHLEPDGTPVTLAVVTDGIGGHQAGEVAAEVALQTFLKSLSTFAGTDPVKSLQASVVEAGNAVAAASLEAAEHEGMGSTLSAALVVGTRLYTVAVGDSRIYLQRARRLLQLTIDHTWVQEAIDHGVITRAMAHRHPNAHVLRRHLGGREETVPDLRLRLSPHESDAQSEANQGLSLLPGDRLLLCTDGLTDLVTDREIRTSLRRRSAERAVQWLVSRARRRGGFDNITAVLLVVPNTSRESPNLRRWAFRMVLRSLLLILLVLAGWFATQQLGLRP